MLRAFPGGLFGVASGSGAPWIVALHGWRRTHDDFARVLDGLDAVALDLPGFGATPPPPEPWGAAQYAGAVAEAVGALDGRPFVVLGHSFGGRVAVELAAARPELVRALVLTGVPLVRPPGATVRRPALAFRIARALNRRGVVSDARMERLRRRHGSADYAAATGVMRQVNVRVVNETYERALGAIRQPVELVWGSDDTEAPPAVAEAARDLLAQATTRLTVVDDAGHLTPLTAPGALRDALMRHRP